jgi:methionine-S-sulfoxide reductase
MHSRTAFLILGSLALACTPSEAKDPAGKMEIKPKPPTKDGPREVAILGAGCFWGVEAWMMKLPGIAEVDVGYAGGKSSKISYEQVTTGTTGHAEAVRIVYDPTVVSYDQMLTWFFKIHDPTTKDRQGNDEGPQYRSAIFPTSEAQKKVAEQVKARLEKSNAWKKPITTTIETSAVWVKAEDYHQDYLVKHPGGYDNHYERPFSF